MPRTGRNCIDQPAFVRDEMKWRRRTRASVSKQHMFRDNAADVMQKSLKHVKFPGLRDRQERTTALSYLVGHRGIAGVRLSHQIACLRHVNASSMV